MKTAAILKPLRIPMLICIGVAALLLGLALLAWRARARVNQIPLSAEPKGVTTVAVRAAQFRPQRRYVGTTAPWLEARLGPQLTAAYVDTVLVRPGAAIARGQVLATLDCRNASAQSRSLAMQARSLNATQEAVAKEATRVSGLLSGGYVSPNEVDRKTAESASRQAELLAANARLSRATLEVDDCVLRAPFDGEVSDRLLDPGGFARPGTAILHVVDRSTVRVSVDVPESDFAVVKEGTPVRIKLLALEQELKGTVTRRSPSADLATRTIHAEIDLSDPERRIPVGTTAELTIAVGQPQPASEVPLPAASVRGDSATLFVVTREGGEELAHQRKLTVMGESGGSLFLPTTLAAGSQVVLQGRGLKDGERVRSSAVELK